MSSPDKLSQDEPPSYNVITPSAPSDTYLPTNPSQESHLTLIKGVPPGLEPLLQMSQITVRERFKVTQGWGSRAFDVLNGDGQRVFQADMTVACCGPVYNLMVRDNGGNEVMQVLEKCGCPCCPREIEVHCPPGSLIGWGKQHWNAMVVTQMTLLNASREVVLFAVGPGLQTCIFGNCNFEVKSKDEQHDIGLIRMQGDHFVVLCPLDMEVTVKASLLGIAMCLENLIVEKKRQVERKARR